MTQRVALTDVDLCGKPKTHESKKVYHELLNSTRVILEDRLKSIDEKHDTLLEKIVTGSAPVTSASIQTGAERLSIKQGLAICDQLFRSNGQFQSTTDSITSAGDIADEISVPDGIVHKGLSDIITKLRHHQELFFDQLITKMEAPTLSPEAAADVVRLGDKWEIISNSIDILFKANSYCNRSIVENYATGDAVQIIADTNVTNKRAFHGTNRGLGRKSKQFIAFTDKETLQHICHNLMAVTIQVDGVDSPLRKATPRPGVDCLT
ncbi:hypothetical protein GGI35DRAFT_291220 [Trichoderma velutinum]